MFISMNWIKDFVDLSGLDTDRLIHQFSLSTAEVENEIFYKGRDLSGVVVGEILSVDPHPDSKKLHLLQVDCGEKEPSQVVCGAPNVRAGMKTAFAKVGARLGEITSSPRNLAGYTSYGMCCSERELGISDNHEGIMDLPAELVNGTDLKTVYDIDDVIFEVDNKSLTNRPDLWGHYGIAREFATLANRPLKPLETADLAVYDGLPKIDMKIEDPLCQRYSCLRFENISKNVSPLNMRIRLYYCGMRGINLLTDLTNYLMLEMGQPMHAFDSRKVESIRIKRFSEPFVFQTLDGAQRNIDENTLMICNGEKPVAIAGIMGGLDSEIVEDTHSLVLESATFDAVSVRKSSARLAHRTDASMRYEKSLDPEMTTVAIARFVKLLQDIDGGVKVTSSLTDEYAFHYKPVVLNFDKAFVDRYTGIDIPSETIGKTLKALGFGVETSEDGFTVRVPSYRATKDITMKADIIEEITRIYGYDNFAVHTAKAPLYPVRPFEEKAAEDKIKDLLVKRYSLHELHSYIWAYYDECRKLGIEVEDNIKLAGATNPNIETIRRSIIPTQLCQVRNNTQYAPSFGIFEIGRVVEGLKENGLCNEKKKLAVTLFDKSGDTEELYRKLISMLTLILGEVKHQKLRFEKATADHAYIHPKNYNKVLCGEKELGVVGVVHPTVQKKIDKRGTVVFAELDMEVLSGLEDKGIHYERTSRYPSVEVDLSFVTDRFDPIAKAISEADSPLIKKVVLVDRYADDQGNKSMAVRLTFLHEERTLTKEEVMAVVDQIVAVAAKEGAALKQ